MSVQSVYNNINAATLSSSQDPARFFNNLFAKPLTVNVDVAAGIQTYFETVTKNKQSAEILSTAVIVTATRQNVEPMELLKEFKKQTPGEINAYLAAFLNLGRIPTSLLGVTNTPQINQFVKRAIKA